MELLRTDLGRFRVVSFLEGVSYVVLLGIAMPLKYLADMPFAVRVAGSVHGALFVLFVLALARVFFSSRWSVAKAAGAFVAALVPIGAFVLERRLAREEDEGPSDE